MRTLTFWCDRCGRKFHANVIVLVCGNCNPMQVTTGYAQRTPLVKQVVA
nr:hypothetical protein [Mycobacterium eburneum]